MLRNAFAAAVRPARPQPALRTAATLGMQRTAYRALSAAVGAARETVAPAAAPSPQTTPRSKPKPKLKSKPKSTARPAPTPSAATPSVSDFAGDGTETIPGTAIRVFRTVAGIRAWRWQRRLAGRSVGLVPTMGALHEGHLSLVRAAMRDNDAVVVSVYVNPTQFGVSEDLDSYPRTWDEDGQLLAAEDAAFAAAAEKQQQHGRVEAVFAPTTAEMYPSGPPSQEAAGPGSYVTITPLGSILEGASRPTFFRGVATVCMKLFVAVQPDRAHFGQKDVQQTLVLRRMVRDFMLPVDIVVAPTVRDPVDGLALSSRNVYLGDRRRPVAGVLRRALLAAARMAHSGWPADAVVEVALSTARDEYNAQRRMPGHRRALFDIDYMALGDPDDLSALPRDAAVDPARGAILTGAIRMLPVEEPLGDEDLGLGEGPPVRLIDNIVIEPWEGETAAKKKGDNNSGQK